MFKKTVNLSEFKAHAPDLLGLLGDDANDDALQLVHRAGTIKVIITQERYFKLLGKIRAYEEQSGKFRPEFIEVDDAAFDDEIDQQIRQGLELANADKG